MYSREHFGCSKDITLNLIYRKNAVKRTKEKLNYETRTRTQTRSYVNGVW